MTIPSSSNYPDVLDNNTNLYEVHDSARVQLTEDYNPGDKSITVSNDILSLAKFPVSGLITLTEQCNEPDKRAISFFYSSRTDNVFSGLEILPGFEDVIKSKKITNVTQNVMASHHNQIKDAVIAIEKFVGIKGSTDKRPLGETMEGRINFLRKLVLRPRAWFTSDRTTGIVPFTVEFNDLSFQIGTDGTTGDIHYTWDFGDQTDLSLVSTISATDEVDVGDVNVIVEDTDGGKIKKTYSTAGRYDVSLTVKNDMGSSILKFPGYIYARIEAPAEAIINLIDRPGQLLLDHDRYDNDGNIIEGVNTSSPPDFTTTFPPILKTKVGTLVDIQIPDGLNTVTGKSYSGELLDGNNDPIDPVTSYTWSLSDDLTQSNNRIARAAYSIGGLYNVIVRTDTDLNSYRITQYPNVIDVVEDINLWLWNYSGDIDNRQVRSYEFGLLSETFKTEAAPLQNLNIDSSFLVNTDDNPVLNSDQLVQEFNRNNGMTQRTTASSGNGGEAVLYWATGRAGATASTSEESPNAEDINFLTYNAFQGTYSTSAEVPAIPRRWNWIGINALEDIYFLLGVAESSSYESLTNQSLVKKNLTDFSASSSTLTDSDYKNGAEELKNNIATFITEGSDEGKPYHGHFSAYRTAYKNNTGYIIRNDGVGPTFRLKSFYRTEGVTSDPIQTIRKLTDMPGAVKYEGQIVPLTSGLYFFNNSSSISVYNDVSNVWETGQSLATSFVSLQDASVTGFGDAANTLLAASDGDRKAYLSFDYSSKAFVSFNETDLTFKSLGSRPTGTQWQMGIY